MCNHPELFERAEVISPMAFCQFGQTSSISRDISDPALGYSSRNWISQRIPRIFYEELFPAKKEQHLESIWNPYYIAKSAVSSNGILNS